MHWQAFTFNQLTTDQLYEILKLRVDIFVVEQNCPYPELDEKDRHQETLHLLGIKNEQLLAYARLLAPGVSYDDASMGRFVVLKSERQQNIGTQLLEQSIQTINQHWPEHNIRISAQAHLQAFYESAGFEKVSAPYLEDDIPHIEMLLARK